MQITHVALINERTTGTSSIVAVLPTQREARAMLTRRLAEIRNDSPGQAVAVESGMVFGTVESWDGENWLSVEPVRHEI